MSICLVGTLFSSKIPFVGCIVAHVAEGGNGARAEGPEPKNSSRIESHELRRKLNTTLQAVKVGSEF